MVIMIKNKTVSREILQEVRSLPYMLTIPIYFLAAHMGPEASQGSL